MTVKEHYDNHLGIFYSWYNGDFEQNKNTFKAFCKENKINPEVNNIAFDLGAGNGIQSVALAELGFTVTAIDFNIQLLDELANRSKGYPINIVNDDMRNIKRFSVNKPSLIICCGDTLPHLESFEEIEKFLSDLYETLTEGGKIILTFRDYSMELKDTQRFIPIKSDAQRVFTCFLEYFEDKVRVTDLLYELEEDQWVQKTSSYFKVRINKQFVADYLKNCGFIIVSNKMENRLIHIVAQK